MIFLFGVIILVNIATAVAIQNGENPATQWSSRSLPPSLILPSTNASALPLNQSIPNHIVNTNTSNGIVGQCDGLTYGFFTLIERRDCQDVMKGTRTDEKTIKFAERGTPQRFGQVVPLPWRWMGPDATCYAQVALLPGASAGQSRHIEIYKAVTALIQQRAVGLGQGGFVYNIGGDNNLGIILSKYEYNHRALLCKNAMRKENGCKGIVTEMQVSIETLRFGPESDERSDVIVPRRTEAHDSTCKMRIVNTYRHGEPSASSWFQLWEAANAVYYKCVHTGMGGLFRNLGHNHDLILGFTER